MPLFRRAARRGTPAAPSPAGGPLADRPVRGPLVDLSKKAAVSLAKAGLGGERAAVHLVLDHSYSMLPFYEDGSVQRLAEQALALSANLDDDGVVPVTYFSSTATAPFDVRIDDHEGVIARTHPEAPWGGTDYCAAIQAVLAHHTDAGEATPAFVIFQTDGAPDSEAAVEKALRDCSTLPVFWAFVGFGRSVSFLRRLDTLAGRAVDNASFFHAKRPLRVSDEELYDGLTHEYADWLAAARAAGIVG